MKRTVLFLFLLLLSVPSAQAESPERKLELEAKHFFNLLASLRSSGFSARSTLSFGVKPEKRAEKRKKTSSYFNTVIRRILRSRR